MNSFPGKTSTRRKSDRSRIGRRYKIPPYVTNPTERGELIMREKKTMHRSIIIFAIVCISLFVISGLSAQDSENIEQIGRLYSFWDNTEAIDVQGNYAYAAAGLSGLQILDVSNPESLFVT